MVEEKITTTGSYKWLVLLVVSVGTAMSALDTGVVNVAYPEMTRFFGVPITTITWVSLAYLIVSSATITTFGRLADLWGRKWIYVAGLAVFCLGSLLCGLAPTAWFLIAARIVEALGAAMALANSIALLSEVFPAHQRGMAIGTLETAVAVALTLGPTLGGYLISAFGWSAVFFINLPLGLINITLAIFLLQDVGERKTSTNLDLTGTISFGGSIALLLLVLTQGQEQGWLSLFTLGFLAVSVILLVFFIKWESRIKDPAIDLQLFFANRAFASANAAKILGYNAFFGINFMIPFYLDQLLRFDAKTIGVAMIPYTAALGTGSFSSSFLADRFSPRWLTTLGLGLVAIGAFVLAWVTPEMGYVVLIPALALSGVGMGLFITPNDKTIMNAAPRDRMGVAGSTLALTRSLGMISGIALAGTLYSFVAGSRLGGSFDPQLSLQSFHIVFFVVCAVALAGATLTASLPESK